VVLTLLGPTNGVCQAQMAVPGHWGGWGHRGTANPLWPPWVVSPMQQVLGSPIGPQRVRPGGATSAWCHQWGAPGTNGSVWLLGAWVHRGTAGYCGHCRWWSPSSRCWGDPVVSNEGVHVVIPLLGATSGVYQTQMVVPGHLGAGVHKGTTGYCGHHGWFTPPSRCWRVPVGPKGCNQVVLPLLAATSGVHQGQMHCHKRPM